MLKPDIQSETEAVAQAALSTIDSWEAREARPLVRGVCIDSDHSLDRDDAIWFEETDGKLIVDVTIADVASFISKGSLLDERARKMTETEYGANTVVEPMFPFRLSQDDGVNGNGIFSLSDKSIRAGMTTRVTLDMKSKRLLNVEIFPSLIHPQIANYQQVADDIEQNPQGQFAKWAEYTTLLKRLRRRSNEGVLPISMSDELQDKITHISEEGSLFELSSRESAASKMVEETALLANRANARFFDACHLPYLFRVHQVKLEGINHHRGYETLSEASDARQALMKSHQSNIKLILDRATYAARRTRHAALGEYAYSHVTSPIRRYSDIPNQRMQHWVSETIAEISFRINQAASDISIEHIAHTVGQLRANPEKDIPSNGAKIIQWVGQLRLAERETSRKHCRKNLHKYLAAFLHGLSPALALDNCQTLATGLIGKLDAGIHRPPYNAMEMDALAREINLHQASRKLTERERLAQKLMLTQIERELELAELQVLNALEMDNHTQRAEAIAAFSAEKRFPLALHLASQQKREYRIPAREILNRMREGRLKEPSDLATLLVQMKIPTLADAMQDPAFEDEESQIWIKQNIEDWKRLKETLLHRFLNNPSFTKGFLKYLEERYGWEIHSTHASLIADGAIAATMSLNPIPHETVEKATKATLFPPSFSIGHWGKTTRHHARIELLRGLAFDILVSSKEAKLPRALRLMTASGMKELTSSSSTIDLLKEKAEEADIHVERHWNRKTKAYHIQASTHDTDKDPISFISVGENKKMARALAWQALLRSKLMRPVHEGLFRKREQLQAIPIDADDALEWIDETSDWINRDLRRSSTNQFTQRREPIWQSRMSLLLNKTVKREFMGESTQAEVADTFANEAGLRYLRERADYGDTKIEQILRDYEKQILTRYAQGNEISSRVPYSAKMNGRDIIPAITPQSSGLG